MNAETFAEWLRRQGYHVVRTPSSYWYETSSRDYQAFPYHWVIEPDEGELNQLLRQNRAIALRYSTPFTAPRGKLSYHVVCQDPAYELATLPRQARLFRCFLRSTCAPALRWIAPTVTQLRSFGAFFSFFFFCLFVVICSLHFKAHRWTFREFLLWTRGYTTHAHHHGFHGVL